MDAATAAVLAALIAGTAGASGALFAPHLTAKRARETELLKMRRDAYVAAIEAVINRVEDLGNPQRHLEIAVKMVHPVALMRLLASPDVVELYVHLWNVVGELATTTDAGKRDALYYQHRDAMKAFTEAARAHIGVDEIER